MLCLVQAIKFHDAVDKSMTVRTVYHKDRAQVKKGTPGGWQDEVYSIMILVRLLRSLSSLPRSLPRSLRACVHARAHADAPEETDTACL